MLIIRQAQMDAFTDVYDIEFVERLKKILRQTYPKKSFRYDDRSFEEMIREGLRRARELYGMRWETALGDFCGLRLQLGEHFDEEPRINVFLTDKSVPPNERIDRMFQEISESDWKRIRRNINKPETKEKVMYVQNM